MIFILSAKLDKKTEREWEEKKVLSADIKLLRGEQAGSLNLSVEENVLPTLEEFLDFLDFLRRRADMLETLEVARGGKTSGEWSQSTNKAKESSNYKNRPVYGLATLNNSPTVKCVVCGGSHYIQSCVEFLNLPVDSTVKKVQELRLCFNCLRCGHASRSCQSNFACKKCKLKHHTILHFDRSASNRQGEGNLDSNARELVTNIDNSVTLTSGIGGVTPQVLLQTALVEILDSQGVPQVCRALLDGASQSHLISEECCNRLGLNKIKLPTLIVGVGQKTCNLQYRCCAQIQSRFNSFKSELSLIVIPKISGVYPVEYVNASPWQLPTNLQLADPTFNTPGNIDVLIGSGIYLNLLCVGQVRLGTKMPTLQKTQFGWVLGGEVSSHIPTQRLYCNLSSNLDLQEQMSRFWEFGKLRKCRLLGFHQLKKRCVKRFSSKLQPETKTDGL